MTLTEAEWQERQRRRREEFEATEFTHVGEGRKPDEVDNSDHPDPDSDIRGAGTGDVEA